LALSLGISAIGGSITRTSVSDWYPSLAKPWFTPPGWTFSIVWTLLFLLMGVSAWLFFGFRAIGWALVEIVVLWAAVVMTAISFYRVSRPASLLLAPYVLWLSFAIALNASIWALNTT
jgi:benzodiazapine receptor